MTEKSQNLTIVVSENGRKSYRFTTPLLEGYTLGRDPYREFRKGVKIITYQDELIKPFYFSISNGYTENSEDYWSTSYPYLKSVNSEWDKTAPNYEVQTEFTLDELRNKFNNKSLTKDSFVILNKTEGKNVNEILVGDKVYSGREFREILGLRSADFSLTFNDNKVIITTYGYGHGVGMSQYGANELAKQGKNYRDIINHYYQNVNIIEKNY